MIFDEEHLDDHFLCQREVAERDARIRELEAMLNEQQDHLGVVRADNLRLTNRILELETALRTIQAWDCLNPPRSDLLADLPWLRNVVDAALGSTGETKP
jgi:small-conductance mechanosensitive channel